MEIKIGDTLISKPNPNRKTFPPFEGDVYEVTKIEIYPFSVFYRLRKKGNENMHVFHNNKGDILYIWNFFYTKAEWREKQIDSILND